MATDIDRSRLQTRNRFGHLSKNMFFARHVAQPRYLGFIDGTAGQRICHVREHPIQIPMPLTSEFSVSLLTDPRFNVEFPENSMNESLLRSYNDRLHLRKRRERLLPPLPGWNPSGTVVEDTTNWKRELAHIAEDVGLVTADELMAIEHRKQSPLTPKSPVRPLSGQYSRRTGRWNETPKTPNRSRSARRRTPFSSTQTKELFCVDEHEREMWMLQVLCQILQTESISDIQSWLVSAGPNEKEAVRQLINTALRGLQENERLPTSYNDDDNAKGTQVNMDSLGSLLATRFPQVSSINTNTENGPPPPSRGRTAPSGQNELRNDLQSRSMMTIKTNLETVQENSQTGSKNVTVTELPEIKIDLVRDVQILTLNDDNDGCQGKDSVPF